jgi:hypothetical protein
VRKVGTKCCGYPRNLRKVIFLLYVVEINVSASEMNISAACFVNKISGVCSGNKISAECCRNQHVCYMLESTYLLYVAEINTSAALC